MYTFALHNIHWAGGARRAGSGAMQGMSVSVSGLWSKSRRGCSEDRYLIPQRVIVLHFVPTRHVQFVGSAW